MMLKNVFSIFLVGVAAFTMTSCDSKDVRACKKLAHQQFEDLCSVARQEFEKAPEELREVVDDQEGYDAYSNAATEAIKAQYPFCFDNDLMKQTLEKVDLACESDPAVVTRQIRR